MSAEVILEATAGGLAGEEFVFTGPARCVVGRSPICGLPLPTADCSVSRRHCLLEIDPPSVVAQDLGSLNGTYVNDEPIGRRPEGLYAWEAAPLPHARRALEDGDELRVGTTCFRIHVLPPAGPGDTALPACPA